MGVGGGGVSKWEMGEVDECLGGAVDPGDQRASYGFFCYYSCGKAQLKSRDRDSICREDIVASEQGWKRPVQNAASCSACFI